MSKGTARSPKPKPQNISSAVRNERAGGLNPRTRANTLARLSQTKMTQRTERLADDSGELGKEQMENATVAANAAAEMQRTLVAECAIDAPDVHCTAFDIRSCGIRG